MPYKSEAQRRYFNSPAGKAKIGKEEVEHWNEVSKGKELPEKEAKIELNNKRRTHGMKAIDKAIRICDESYTVSVKEASDRDASRAIGIAQRIGFITKDKGYTIDLIGGNASMFNKFKREIVGIKGVKII